MIYTVYLNPTIDKTVYFNEFSLGQTNRPIKSVTVGAGKAVNVSVVLGQLGESSTCAGYVYSDDSACIVKRLKDHGANCFFEEYSGSSRVNTKIFDYSTRKITEINESGDPVSSDAIAELAKKLVSIVYPGDTVILTGSLPKGADAGLYAEMIEDYERKDVFCVLDTSGEALKLGIKACPDLIKPNDEEFSFLTGYDCSDISIVPDKLIEFGNDSGIRYIGLTLGSRGAFLSDGSNVYFADPIKVDVLSTVGAGDSMIAGIIHGLGNGTAEALKCGVAAATASIMREGTKLMLKSDYDDIYGSVRVMKVL